ncbi:hypothetical protein [Paenibacillus sp. NPDC058174]|uniref:hypothetical protein n=1 Tax=Paenibacillus sp. NPDC058174 TaxID=3346366 RepID=UPI0036D89859
MGNRTFLSVNAEAAEGQYEDVAFETNNFLAPFWFSLASQEQYQGYHERLLTAWNAVEPHLEDEELEERPEWEAFARALSWHIPWGEAVQQLRQCLPVVLARFPALAPHLSEWLETLFTHIKAHRFPVVHLELAQYFHFYMDPQQYLEEIERFLHLWWYPDEMGFAGWEDKMNPYLMGGEHLPKEEQDAAGRNKDEAMMTAKIAETEVHHSVPSKKQSSKRLEKLYIWLLSILSGALFLGALLLTANMWLAVLAFLLPAICIFVWELLIRPRKNRSVQNESLAPPIVIDKIAYYEGASPINFEGVEVVNADTTGSVTVPWHHVMQAQISLPNQIILILHTEFESLYPSPVVVNIDDNLSADYIASAINSIAGLSRH